MMLDKGAAFSAECAHGTHWRIHVPDGCYPMMSRGNGGEVLCRCDEDRRRFLGLLSELPERLGDGGARLRAA